jgi:hypothetical protein
MINELVKHGRKRKWSVSKYNSNICLIVLRKIIKTYQDVKIVSCPGFHNWTPERKAIVLTTMAYLF